MYYRKYFAGSVENSNLTRSNVQISNGSSTNEYYVRDDVICRAVMETLEDVGISCEYNDQKSTLNIDGVTVQFFGYNNVGYTYYNANGVQFGSQTSSPFSGNNYNFYVTLKGDTDSILMICIGYYTAPASESFGIVIGKGIDLKDGAQIRTVGSITNAANSNFYVIKNDEIFVDYKNAITFGFQMTNESKINGNGTEITLVECIAQPGRFKLNNCYFGTPMLINNYFYNIGGDIYYKLSNNILVKNIN